MGGDRYGEESEGTLSKWVSSQVSNPLPSPAQTEQLYFDLSDLFSV